MKLMLNMVNKKQMAPFYKDNKGKQIMVLDTTLVLVEM